MRFFYQRTWQKIRRYVKFPEEVPQHAREVYALVNYSVIRTRIKKRESFASSSFHLLFAYLGRDVCWRINYISVTTHIHRYIFTYIAILSRYNVRDKLREQNLPVAEGL